MTDRERSSDQRTRRVQAVTLGDSRKHLDQSSVGDVAGHAYVLDQVKCTALKGSIGGVQQKEGLGTEFSEAMGDNAKGHGFFVETLSSGDKIHYTYTLTGVTKDGKPVSGSNAWTAVGGTGKFKGATGKATCSGKGNPDGSANYDCTGNIAVGGK